MTTAAAGRSNPTHPGFRSTGRDRFWFSRTPILPANAPCDRVYARTYLAFPLKSYSRPFKIETIGTRCAFGRGRSKGQGKEKHKTHRKSSSILRPRPASFSSRTCNCRNRRRSAIWWWASCAPCTRPRPPTDGTWARGISSSGTRGTSRSWWAAGTLRSRSRPSRPCPEERPPVDWAPPASG